MGDVLGLDHDQIADFTVSLAIQGPSEWYPIMKRKRLSISEAARAEQKIEGQHRLERLYRPIALLRYCKSKLNPETWLTRGIISRRFFVPGVGVSRRDIKP